MTDIRVKRNRMIRAEIDKRRQAGMAIDSAIWEASEAFFLEFDTVKKIYYDPNYETRYKPKKVCRR